MGEYSIQGLEIEAYDKNNKIVPVFRVFEYERGVFFGVRNEDSTDREILELRVKDK